MGWLQPGESIQITTLSDQLGVSHIPVREALRQLESEGLVEHKHGRRVTVAPVTATWLREVYRLRLAIEPDLAALAVKCLDERQITHLQNLLGQLDATAIHHEDFTLVRNVHAELHRAIIVPAASQWDLRVLNMLWQASERSVSVVFLQWVERGMDYLLADIHQPLLDAAVARQPKRMRAALTKHLRDGVNQLAEALEETSK